jgi:hypothetical protein
MKALYTISRTGELTSLIAKNKMNLKNHLGFKCFRG